ncbi:dynactin arp1 p62 subunit ro2 [Botrytis cinerea]
MGLYTGGSFGDRKTKSKNASMREACDSTEGLQIYDPEAEYRLQPGSSTLFAQFLASSAPNDPNVAVPAVIFYPNPNLKSQPHASVSASPTQFLLTFKNPLFEPVKISLATKGLTTDRHASKVILLCPQFEVGANTDMWDEALQDSSSSAHDRKHSTATHGSMASMDLSNEAHGKPWDKGRNWTSVVVEVTPGKLKTKLPGLEQQRRLEEEVQKERVEEDADVCEIAVFVRVEWEADAAGDGDGAGKMGGLGDRDGREKRELAYWCVVGVGRIGK